MDSEGLELHIRVFEIWRGERSMQPEEKSGYLSQNMEGATP